MSIKDFDEKIKSYGLKKDELIISIIILLSVFGGFGLGRLSVMEEEKPPIGIEAIPLNGSALTATAVQPRETKSGLYVASKTGRTYHYPWCSGAQRIKEENRIYFNSASAARGAGYKPAKNCKGLK